MGWFPPNYGQGTPAQSPSSRSKGEREGKSREENPRYRMENTGGNGRAPFEEVPPGDEGPLDRDSECPLEVEIEHLVLEGEKTQRREELLSHLENCFSCNEIFEKLTQFYRDSLRDGLAEGRLPGMPSPPPELFSDCILHLLPSANEHERAENPEDLYANLSTLSSSEGKVTGKFLLSRQTGEILASFQTESGERLAHVVFMVPILKKKFLTDHRGIAVVGRREPGLFMDAHVKLCLPLLRFTAHVGIDLTQEETHPLTPVPGFPAESALVYLDEDSSLCVEFSFGDGEVSPHLTAICVGRGKPEVARLTEGIAFFKGPHLGGPLQISVFPV